MATYVDDIAVTFQGKTLGDIVQEAQDRVTPIGRVIVEVEVEGEPLIGDKLMERADDQVADLEIKLITADPNELIIETLNVTRESLDEALEFQNKAADCLQRDDEAQGMKLLAEAINVWQMTQQAVEDSAALKQIPLEELAAGDQSFEQLVKQLIEQLESLKELLAARDMVAVADTLAYEWPETTEHWRDMIDQLIAKIESD